MNDSPVSRAELGAFVDGELDLARTLAIEARLARDAGLRAEVEAGVARRIGQQRGDHALDGAGFVERGNHDQD